MYRFSSHNSHVAEHAHSNELKNITLQIFMLVDTKGNGTNVVEASTIDKHS